MEELYQSQILLEVPVLSTCKTLEKHADITNATPATRWRAAHTHRLLAQEKADLQAEATGARCWQHSHTAMLKAEAAGQRFLLVPTFFALSAKSAQLCATQRVAKHKESWAYGTALPTTNCKARSDLVHLLHNSSFQSCHEIWSNWVSTSTPSAPGWRHTHQFPQLWVTWLHRYTTTILLCCSGVARRKKGVAYIYLNGFKGLYLQLRVYHL